MAVKRKKYRRVAIGDVFGRLTVEAAAPKQANGRAAWHCVCSCGNKLTVLQQSLVGKKTTSCGCFHRECSTDNLLGKVFGFWTVTGASTKRTRDGSLRWICTCSCGTIKDVSSILLKNGQSTSCGCSRSRSICPKGHSIEEWGRDSKGMCRACIKNRNYLRNYGITLDEYVEIWKYQGGKCAICGDEVSLALGRPGMNSGCRAELDHEHNKQLSKHDQVRGILCGGRWAGCNRRLGHIDNHKWLQSAADYIKNPPARMYFLERVSNQ